MVADVDCAPEPLPARPRPAARRRERRCRLRRGNGGGPAGSQRRCSPPGCSSAAPSCPRSPRPRLNAAAGRAAGRRAGRADRRDRRAAPRAPPSSRSTGPRSGCSTRVRSADRELDRVARRDALVGGLGEALWILACGLTVVGVLAVAVSAHHAGELNRVLVATLALVALAAFESVQPLPATARELSATLAAGRRVLELIEREPAIADPLEPLPAPAAPRRGARACDRPLRPRRAGGLRGPRPAPRSRPTCRARRPERQRQDDGDEPPPALPRPGSRPRQPRRA